MITGDGELTATGGAGSSDIGAGAGIGGNGFGHADGHSDAGDFGYIVINSGNIKANGGEAYYYSSWSCYLYGAAGIGGGGVTEGWQYAGDISINGGTVSANGSVGGAGIGSGTADGSDTYSDTLNIAIGGGTVTAQGGGLSAGIGGGDCGSAGTIVITGGDVTAVAGASDDPLGAAGIGGGSNGSVKSVSVSGGARVVATASGGAAGIGGGANTSYGIQWGDKDGTVTEERLGIISISGAGTEVTAYGGTSTGYSGTYGGAGIGSGYPVSNNSRSVAFQISITDGCSVQAYGGYHSNAIGYGYRPTDMTGYGITLTLDDTISLFAQNYDYYQPALVSATGYDNGRTPVTYLSNSSYLVYYADEDRNASSAGGSNAPGYLSVPSASADEIFEWSFDSQTMILSVGSTEINTERELNGNWAALIKQMTFNVTYNANGGADAPVDAQNPYSAMSTPVVLDIGSMNRTGYTFAAWNTARDGSGTAYRPGDTLPPLTSDVVLYARWEINKYTVTWMNGDDILETDTGVDYGTKPSYDGTIPTMPDSAHFTYTFAGWSSTAGGAVLESLPSVTRDVTYYAQFTVTLKPIIPPRNPVGTAVLVKVDSNDNNICLPGARFELYKVTGNISCLVGFYISDRSGKITVEELSPGSYYWQEIGSPEGYTLDSTKHEFIVTDLNTTTVTVENSKTIVPEAFAIDHYAYIVGCGDGLVHPEANITRAEVATIFFRLLSDEVRNANVTNVNSFSDVDVNAWYNTAVSTMANMGIVGGYPDGSFGPDNSITRAEFAAIAARFEQYGNTTDASFTDIYGHWAMKEISIAANNGWVLGYEDGTFRPDQKITRAEAITTVNRVLQRVPENTSDLLDDMIKWQDNMDTSKWYYIMIQEATNSHSYERKPNGYKHWSELRPVRDWTDSAR